MPCFSLRANSTRIYEYSYLFFRGERDNVYGWHLDTRRLLRFTARIANKGNADFRPAIAKHLWQFHACHMYASQIACTLLNTCLVPITCPP